MSVVNILADKYSVFHKTLLFFMRLAWRSRITLPYLIMIGFMILDIRMTLEITIEAEHHPPDGNAINDGDSDSDSDHESDNYQIQHF